MEIIQLSEFQPYNKPKNKGLWLTASFFFCLWTQLSASSSLSESANPFTFLQKKTFKNSYIGMITHKFVNSACLHWSGFLFNGYSRWYLYAAQSNSDWLFIIQSSILQADWIVLKSSEKVTSHIGMPYSRQYTQAFLRLNCINMEIYKTENYLKFIQYLRHSNSQNEKRNGEKETLHTTNRLGNIPEKSSSKNLTLILQWQCKEIKGNWAWLTQVFGSVDVSALQQLIFPW